MYFLLSFPLLLYSLGGVTCKGRVPPDPKWKPPSPGGRVTPHAKWNALARPGRVRQPDPPPLPRSEMNGFYG